ncbi:MAG: hypothetical protein V8R55_01620 [Dysosmobacter sp.]
MAIVKMKKLRVVAMAASREELLRGLQHLGCVEISEPENITASDPMWASLVRRETSDLSAARSRITDVNTALAAIKRYGGVKDGMFVPRNAVSEEKFLSESAVEPAREITDQVCQALKDLARLQGEENRLVSRQAGCAPGPRWTCRWS